MKKIGFLLLLTLIAVVPCAAQYSVRLVDCPGVISTRLWGINNSGLIVGALRWVPGGIFHAMVYRNGVCESLESVIGSGRSRALGVNDRGEIVGDYDNHGFVLRDGVLTTVDYPGADGTSASAINNLGDVVGTYTVSGQTKGFRMNRSGEMTSFSLNFPDVVDFLPLGINLGGDIVGNWDTGNGTIGHGWFLKSKGAALSFDVPDAPVDGTFAAGINGRGDIVGYFGQIGSTSRGFAWLGDTLVPLDSPTPAIFMLPNSINNHRVIVGSILDDNGVHGFIAVYRM